MARALDHGKEFKPLAWIAPGLPALLLLALAVPGLAAQLYAWPATQIVKRVSSGDKSIAMAQLLDTAAGLNRAVAFEPGNRTHFNSAATISLRLVEQYQSAAAATGGRTDDARVLLNEARGYILDALKSAPADANLWYLLAEVRNRLEGPDRACRGYLAMSYSVGPREGWLSHRRLAFALKLWPKLNQELRAHVRGDIRNLWTGQHGNRWGEFRIALVKLFLRSGPFARQLIAQDVSRLGDMKMFRSWLKKFGGSADLSLFLR